MHDSIEHFTLRTTTEKVIVASNAHYNRVRKEELPDDPPTFAEDALARFRATPSLMRGHTWVLWHRGRIAAKAALGWAELPTNRHGAFVNVSVERELRRRGIGSRLLSLAVAEAARARRPKLTAVTSDRVPAGEGFARGMGFRRGLATHMNQLVLAKLDRGLMARWIQGSAERAGDYAIELWEGPVPEASLAAYAGLVEVMNTAPRGDLAIEDTKVTPEMIRAGEAWLFANGSRRLLAVVRHQPTGAFAGFTELTWNPKRAAIVWQGDTGVVPAHRDKGLGRWLKAFNVEALVRANPVARFVRTGNADSNAPMLAINHQMGFEPLMADTIWQGKAPVIARRLALGGGAEPASRLATARVFQGVRRVA